MPNVVPLPLLPPAYRPLELAEPASEPPPWMKIVHLSTYDVAGGPAVRPIVSIPACVRRESIPQCLWETRTKDDSVVAVEPDSEVLGACRTSPRRAGIRRKLIPSVSGESYQFEPFRSDRSEYGGDVMFDSRRAM